MQAQEECVASSLSFRAYRAQSERLLQYVVSSVHPLSRWLSSEETHSRRWCGDAGPSLFEVHRSRDRVHVRTHQCTSSALFSLSQSSRVGAYIRRDLQAKGELPKCSFILAPFSLFSTMAGTQDCLSTPGRGYLLETLSPVVIVMRIPRRLNSCSSLWRR